MPMPPEVFEEVSRKFTVAFHAHRHAELKFTRMLQYLGRTNGLDPVDESFRSYLDELEQAVEDTLEVYEEKLDELVEAMKERRTGFPQL